MKKLKFTSLLLIIALTSCFPIDEKQKVLDLKQEILNVEAEFAVMVNEVGIAKAFIHYAADDAVLMRNNNLFLGRDAISNMYTSKEKDPNVSLTWTPDFVDVSRSGDMAYTYGEYRYTYLDANGNMQSETGIFHTVWKRQDNGDWKYVWD